MHRFPRWHRRSIRLRGHDYSSPGAYFITICTHDRLPLFGQVNDGKMVVNEYGEIARECWNAIPEHFPHVELDVFIIMPNHIHGIIWIVDINNNAGNNVGAQQCCAPTYRGVTPHNVRPGSLGAIIRSFKSAVTRRINALRDHPGMPVWQRNYFDHIIRTPQTLDAIRQYIIENPIRWDADPYHPDATDASER